MQRVSHLNSKSPNGEFLERYWQSKNKRGGVQEQNRKMQTGSGSTVFPSNCGAALRLCMCADSITHLASGQEVIFNRCAGEDAECECSSCVNEKEQHISGLLAIMTIKLVILSNSKVLNAQISADEDELLIPEQMRWLQ